MVVIELGGSQDSAISAEDNKRTNAVWEVLCHGFRSKLVSIDDWRCRERREATDVDNRHSRCGNVEFLVWILSEFLKGLTKPKPYFYYLLNANHLI